MEACSANAERLIQDAELLLANGRHPSSFESSYFAMEEIAKFTDLYAVGHIVVEGGAVNWKAFWKRWRTHPSKSLSFVMLGNLHHEVAALGHVDGDQIEYDPEAEAKVAGALHVERMAALYVDWTDGLKSPDGVVTQQRAAELLAQAKATRAAAQDLAPELLNPPAPN